MISADPNAQNRMRIANARFAGCVVCKKVRAPEGARDHHPRLGGGGWGVPQLTVIILSLHPFRVPEGSSDFLIIEF